MKKLERENIGLWYLPSCPEEKLTGTLTVDKDNSCKLKMAHSFGGLTSLGVRNISVIHGVLSNGNEITLINSTKTSEQWGFPGFPVAVFTCTLAIIGGLYDQEKEVMLSELKATYKHLNLWLNQKPFNISADQLPMTYSCITRCLM
jgi:hypothetical protein